MPAYIRFSEKQENAKKARFWKVRYEFLELAYFYQKASRKSDVVISLFICKNLVIFYQGVI